MHLTKNHLLSLKNVPASLWVLFIALFFPSVNFAQHQTKAEAITLEDELPFRNVTAITQDSRGLMWFGTQQGICRYDGYRFVVFSNKTGADFPFPADRVLDNGLIFLPDSFLLAIADYQLFKINIVDYKVENLSKRMGIDGNVSFIKMGKSGKVWLSWETDTTQNLGFTDLGELVRVARVPKIRREFTSLAIDQKGYAWWSTISKGIQQYTPEGQLLRQAVVDSFIWFGTKMFFTPLNLDKSDRLFVFPKTEKKVWTLDKNELTVTRFSGELDDLSYHFLEDNQGAYWFGTRKGLHRYRDGTWTDFTETLNSELQFTEIHTLFEDRSNMLWVATDNGLLKIPIFKELFDNYLLVPDKRWGNAMRGIFEDKSGNVFFKCEAGAAKGITRLNKISGKLEKCHIGGDFLTDTLLLDRAKHFVVDTSENIAWTIADNLMKLDLETFELEVVASLEGICNSFSHNPLTQLPGGDLLLGSTVEALAVFRHSTGSFEKIPARHLAAFKGLDTEIFLPCDDGTVWVGTASKGLLKINLAGQLLAQYSTASSPPLSNNHILSIHLAENGNIWIGTFGGGLNVLDEKSGEIKIVNSKTGLTNDNITGILEDEDENIWVSTYNGISVVKSKDWSILNYFEEDGLTNNEFNYTSQYKSSDGTLWFGGMNGVNAIDPSVVISDNQNPALVLTAIETNGKTVENHFLESTSHQLLVKPSYNYFQFSWTLPNYFKPAKNNYYVWMEGLDDGWNYVGNSNSIRYNKLPPGGYIFKVKGADSKGVWGADELAVKVQVQPHFYQTWWFISAMAMLVLGIVYSLGRYRLQRLLEMERMRTRIASDLHDEVGSMLSGLAMQAELMEMNPQANHSQTLAYLRNTSREAVSKMRDLVWSIDSRRDLVKNLLDRMREYAEEILPAKGIEYRFQLGELDMDQKLPSETRQHLYFIFKEAVNNVARHSNADKVTVVFGNFADECRLEIRDNGCVESEQLPKSGLGISNIQMRAKKLQAKLSIASDNGFCILLRLRKI